MFKLVNGQPVELTQEEAQAIQAEWDAHTPLSPEDQAIADNLAARALAVALLAGDTSAILKLDRAIVLAAVDEFNNIRQWLTSFKAAVAAATSLANLQTRIAALPAMPDRTGAQVKAAVAAQVNAGSAD